MDQEQSLKEIRTRISNLDEKILQLLNRRAALSLQVGQIKSQARDSIFKPFREKEVLNGLAGKNQGPLPDEHLRAIYREIFSSSRSLQQKQRVAYLGPEGTFSYFAGVEYLGQSADFFPKDNLEDVFRAVDAREAELGIIPLENSLQGSVGQSLDLFLKFEVFIHAEIFCRISHALLSRESDLAAINKVYSHPQALQQCSIWLRANLPGIPVIPDESTAQAARRAAKEKGAAALGHRDLARIFHLNLLEQGLEDTPDNWTRFLVISSLPPETGNKEKTSLLFTVTDKPGSLVTALQVLSRKGINMKKLESRPMRLEKWRYVFFTDVECDLTSEEYREVLTELESSCHFLRILGSYPHGPQIGA
ncbi:prephenate dehydratase [Desulfonatronovibrio hydrogenovorans]|uniref:prephenate dehydratase n=1 Tax=Desulfonatronovibrio hydrogenovorans TaxID=53245 RepID=UPI000491DA0E|nr:prephenate dehydratase [Desulfonatronovibrio hydrogenovorans]